MAETHADELFPPEEVERGRRYHRPRYVALVLDLALGLAVLGTLAASWPELGLPWALEALVAVTVALGAVTVARLPVAWWSGYVHERRWELSTQSPAGWLADRGKGLLVALALASAAFLGLFAAERSWPEWWPAAGAAGAAALVLVVSFLAPVVLEPVFNRFEPLRDAELRAELLALAERAGVPLREVLVADASRRTRKANAYVSGIGRTRRVVLFDTFLEDVDAREALVVTAHELAHRLERHVARGTALGMLGAAAYVLVLWALPGGLEEHRVALYLLVGSVLQLAAAPLGAWLSRRHERVADRIALELTRDPEAFERLFRRFARRNVADLEPPRLVRLWFGSHPTIPERIRAARAARVPG